MLKMQVAPKLAAIRLAAVFCLAVAVLLFGVPGASAQSGHAAKAARAAGVSYLYNQHGSSVPVGYCANFACTDRYYGNGTAVTMLCYSDMYNWSYGNYWSNRWFYVRYSNWFGSINRWVHSSYVYYQTWVPSC